MIFERKRRDEWTDLERKVRRAYLERLLVERKETQKKRQEHHDQEKEWQREIEEERERYKVDFETVKEGIAHFDAKRYDSAIVVLRPLINRGSNPVHEGQAHQYVAFSYFKKGDDVLGMHEWELARACFRKDDTLGRLYDVELDWFLQEHFGLISREGVKVPPQITPETLKTIDSKFEEGFSAYYAARVETKKYDAAIRTFSELSVLLRACEWKRAEAIARKELGRVYYDSGDRDRAMSEFEVAKKLFREDAEPLQYQDFEKDIERFLDERNSK